VFASADVSTQLLRLVERQPVLRAITLKCEEKHVNAAIGLFANQICGWQSAPRFAPRHLSLFQFRQNPTRNDLVDGCVRPGSACFGLDGRRYRRTGLDRKPKITLAKGERQRDRVLTDTEVELYLGTCEQPWRDVATIMLGTGMRPSEVFSLRWEDILLNGSSGLLQITDGKSKAARRMLPLVPAVHSVLKARQNGGSGWVFPADTDSGHLEGGSAKNYHARALAAVAKAAKVLGGEKTPVKSFPPYVMRHTALTRLAEAGCDAFTLARIAGHSSITITQRYCHPQADAIERAFAKLPGGIVVNDGSQHQNGSEKDVMLLTTGK
jgi:integrase